MEHRCGTRVQMSMGVRLELQSQTVTGQILDLSLSGAFIASPERIPEQTRVVVEVVAAPKESASAPPWFVPAHVVRGSEAGVGIEWDAFAPWPILSLLRRKASQGPRASSKCVGRKEFDTISRSADAALAVS